MEQSKVSEIERKFFFVFPGQGSQYRGMGSDLVSEFESAREIFERSSEVVGYDMAARCFEDPDGKLNLTRFTQPALVTHQLACLAALQNLLGDTAAKPVLTAGHSLGEYSALVVAGALTVENANTLVKRRGELMGEVDVLSNYTGTLHDADSRAIRSRLFFQLFNPVRWFACIQTAFEQDINCIVEFGGGIGSGEAPAEKRPNLESMIKKALKLSAYEADYFPAINVAGIYAIADTLAG